MADKQMNFGVDLLPAAKETYDLGTGSSFWKQIYTKQISYNIHASKGSGRASNAIVFSRSYTVGTLQTEAVIGHLSSKQTGLSYLYIGGVTYNTDGTEALNTTAYDTSKIRIYAVEGKIKAEEFDGTATKATQDESGNNIKASYASSLSISDHTITLNNNNGTSLGTTITVPDENVKQTDTGATTTNNYPLLLSNSNANNTPETAGVKKDYRLVWNPKNYTLQKTTGHLVIKANSNLILDRDGNFILFRKGGATSAGCLIDPDGNFAPYTTNTLGLGTFSRIWGALYVKQGNITGTDDATSTSTGTLIVKGGIGCAKSIHATSVWGAVWNDYAEFRKDNVKEKELQQPGRCVREVGDGTLTLTDGRLQRGCEIISDTFGFAIGQDKENGYNTPIASSGRVLAYLYEDRELARNFIGWPVCSGPNGTVSIMTEEEENRYSNRIVGTISEIPDYEEWGTGKVKVDGRIWIRIK